jgi:hypothetical protein
VVVFSLAAHGCGLKSASLSPGKGKGKVVVISGTKSSPAPAKTSGGTTKKR